MELNEKSKSINNIGGWLMVVQVFIFLNAYGWVRNFQIFSELLNEKDKLIQTQVITDAVLYNYFIYYELAASIIFTVFSIALIYYMFKRSKLFPVLFVIYIILDLLTDGLVMLFFGSVSEAPAIIMQKLIFSLIITILLVSYIKFSRRVKETFIK
jgi:hypothetical protein